MAEALSRCPFGSKATATCEAIGPECDPKLAVASILITGRGLPEESRSVSDKQSDLGKASRHSMVEDLMFPEIVHASRCPPRPVCFWLDFVFALKCCVCLSVSWFPRYMVGWLSRGKLAGAI